MEKGLIYKIKNKNYKMIKEYPNFILFENEFGFKECYTKAELYVLFNNNNKKIK